MKRFAVLPGKLQGNKIQKRFNSPLVIKLHFKCSNTHFDNINHSFNQQNYSKQKGINVWIKMHQKQTF